VRIWHDTSRKRIMSVRRGPHAREPIFAQITAPSTDQDAFLPLHRGRRPSTTAPRQSFMDEYGNWMLPDADGAWRHRDGARRGWEIPRDRQPRNPVKDPWILSMPSRAGGSERRHGGVTVR